MQKLIEDGEDELEKEETDEQENNDGPLSDGEFEAFSMTADLSLVPDSESDDGLLVIPESPTHSSPTTGAYDLAFIDGMVFHMCSCRGHDYRLTGLPTTPSSGAGSVTDVLDLDMLSFQDHDIDPPSPRDQSGLSSAEATAYQEVVLAEDELAARLRSLLSISTNPNIHAIVSQHISPRLQQQLPEWNRASHTAPVDPQHAISTSTTIPSATTLEVPPEAKSLQRTSISPPMLFKPVVGDAIRNPGDVFIGLARQKKERRKESHHIR